ncbi:SdiA-regulated domain-containing protein [Roseobacter ponti]|uniref:Uncharacterized protein n=1 Tax=Roseobacter ponti TaxID=1891787 RepID=A0A858SRL1_9RHOB|nr:SdiA-regulated domain-containing protein [Roseobacter ponti]QJF50313.1 hypothetical protein G3256_03600 [Roseobacter ponti]
MKSDRQHPPMHKKYRRGAALHFLPVLFVCLLVSWARASDGEALRLMDSQKIYDASEQFTEPSGLARSLDGTRFYAVSDNTGAIFVLDDEGSVVDRINPDFPVRDPEGIAVMPDGVLLVLEEGARSVAVIDPASGRRIRTAEMRDLAGIDAVRQHLSAAPKNKGFEGIAVHPVSGHIFIANETEPRLLLEISADFTRLLQWWILGRDAGFSSPHARDDEMDLSGLTIDGTTGDILIVSDTGRSLFRMNPDTQEVRRFDLPGSKKHKPKLLKNAEGVALSSGADRLFVLTDDGRSSRLVTYEWP